MFLGACVDIGLDSKLLETELRKLDLAENWQLQIRRDTRGDISGTKLDFAIEPNEHTPSRQNKGTAESHHHSKPHHHGDPHHLHTHGRHYSEIRDLILASSLSDSVKERAVSMFTRVGKAEAAIHGKSLEEIHFHEVGALDSILDIVGAAIAIDLLGIEQIDAATPADGHGSVECAHGTFPVPAPATLKILEGKPLKQIDVAHELITPTGAAILAEMVDSWGPMAGSTVVKSGYGLGTRELDQRPNVLRLVLCKNETARPATLESDSILLIESNLDDISGERIGHLTTMLMEAGALDVAVIPILMKKGRPGHQIQIMSDPAQAHELAVQVMRTTGTLGVRYRELDRWKLRRENRTVKTHYGMIRLKVGLMGNEVITQKPEADDVYAAARQHNVSVDTVIRSTLS